MQVILFPTHLCREKIPCVKNIRIKSKKVCAGWKLSGTNTGPSPRRAVSRTQCRPVLTEGHGLTDVTYIKCITNVTYHWIIFTLKYFVLWSKVLVTQVNLYFFGTLSFVQQNRHKRWFSFVRIVILSYSSTVAAATPHFSLFVFSLQHTVWEINYKLLRKVDKFLCSVLRH